MNLEVGLQLLLRLLPTILFAVLAFLAAADKKTREQWAELLYNAGSVRPEQRSDPKVQGMVRWPFLIIAFLFLIWPVRYFMHATRTVKIQTTALSGPAPSSSLSKPAVAPTRAPVVSGNSTTPTLVAPPPPGAAATSSPGSGAAGAPRTDLMGRPLPPDAQ